MCKISAFSEINAFSLLRALFKFASAFSHSWNLGQFCKFCTHECFAKKRNLPVKKRKLLVKKRIFLLQENYGTFDRNDGFEMKRHRFVLFQQTAETLHIGWSGASNRGFFRSSKTCDMLRGSFNELPRKTRQPARAARRVRLVILHSKCGELAPT